jgi:hypothetical protein
MSICLNPILWPRCPALYGTVGPASLETAPPTPTCAGRRTRTRTSTTRDVSSNRSRPRSSRKQSHAQPQMLSSHAENVRRFHHRGACHGCHSKRTAPNQSWWDGPAVPSVSMVDGKAEGRTTEGCDHSVAHWTGPLQALQLCKDGRPRAAADVRHPGRQPGRPQRNRYSTDIPPTRTHPTACACACACACTMCLDLRSSARARTRPAHESGAGRWCRRTVLRTRRCRSSMWASPPFARACLPPPALQYLILLLQPFVTLHP